MARSDLRPAMRRATRSLAKHCATAYAVPVMRWYAGLRKFKPCREFVSAKQRAKQHFYVAPNNFCYGGVRFNVIGREPRGSVHPEDLDKICAQLTADLMALVNVETGGPVITGVDKSSRWYRRSPRRHAARPIPRLGAQRADRNRVVAENRNRACALRALALGRSPTGGTVTRLWSGNSELYRASLHRG